MPFQKGHPGYKKPGTKNGATIAAEKLRAQFQEKFGENWQLLLDQQLEDAKKDPKARQYVFDQVIGKPTETVKVEEEVTLKIDL